MLPVLDSSAFNFNLYAVLPVSVALVSFFLGIFIYYIDKKNSFNQGVCYFCLSVFLWQILFGGLLCCRDMVSLRVLSQMLFAAIALTAATTFHLSAALTCMVKQRKSLIVLIYTCALLVVFFIFQKGFFSGISWHFFGMFPLAGPNMYLIVVFVSVCFLLSILNFTKYHFASKEKDERKYARFLMILFFVLQSSFVDIFISYSLESFPLSPTILLVVLLGLCFEQMRALQGNVNKSQKEYSSDLAWKSLEMSKVVSSLKDAQLKLLESGKMSALASLSAGILHQISQPITAINGVSSFLKSEVKEDDQHYKAICLMDEQSTVLREKLNDILELIKQRKVRKEFLNVNDIVTRVMSLVMDELRMKDIKWEAQLEKNMLEVFADSVHLQQICINLITNAIQALEVSVGKDERYLIVSTHCDNEKELVSICFYDTGASLTEEDKDYIFEPFFPVISMRAGIGLALCKDLIDEHAGELTLENVEEGGVRFTVNLPIAKQL